MNKLKYIMIFVLASVLFVMTVADMGKNNIRIDYGSTVRDFYIDTVADGMIRLGGVE